MNSPAVFHPPVFLLTPTSCGSLWDLWGGEINKVYSSTGTGRGTRILEPLVGSLTSTCGRDGCCGQLLLHKERIRAETELSLQTHPAFVVFVCVSKYLWVFSVWDCLSWPREKRRRKKEKDRSWKKTSEKQPGVWWWKEAFPLLSQSLWRPRADEKEPTVQYQCEARQNRKKNKA